MKIPRGWTDYKPYGDRVEGTKLLPFKTPLKMELVQNKISKEQWFTPSLLIANCPQVKAVIDLTDTQTSDRYYNPKEFIEANVEHLKINIRGGGMVPGTNKMKLFSDAVDRFVKKFSDNPDALIGVHCTHGINRTGYFICKYMVMKMRCEPKEALDRFQKARGYAMYRRNFVEEIISPGANMGQPQRPDYRRPPNPVREWRSGNANHVACQEPNWNSFHSDRRYRRDRYAYGASASPRTSAHHPQPYKHESRYSWRKNDYKSHLEDGPSSNRYHSRYKHGRNGMS